SAVRDLGVRAGVALNPATPAAMVQPVIHMVDLVLVMTVNPGFGGQAFIPETLDKIAAIKSMAEKAGIGPLERQVAGGMAGQTARAAGAAGATVRVAGTSILRHDDRAQAIKRLRQAAGRA